MKPIGFVIITYNRPDDMLALAQNISQLSEVASLLEEVVIINNNSTSDYGAVQKFIQSHPDIPFKYVESSENLGVAKGRNFALSKSTAPILIMLDDDAVLQHSDSLIQIKEAFENNFTNHPIAIVSFKVLYYDTLEMQVNALPHKKFQQKKDLQFFETYYYAGGAHAIKREVLDHIGPYSSDFFYGMEEYDLSYRVLENGYAIVYDSNIVMLHKESPLGRKPKNEKLRMMWVNKTKVSWRYLPKKYFYTTALLWSFFYLRHTRFHLRGFYKGWKEIFRIPRFEKRKPLSRITLSRLKKMDARLYY